MIIISLRTASSKMNYAAPCLLQCAVQVTNWPQTRLSFKMKISYFQRETEGVDADLINITVLSLRGLKADKETDEKMYKQGVVAYYVNRWVERSLS